MDKRLFNFLRNTLKYILTLTIAAFLLWYVYKDIDFQEAVLQRLGDISYGWIALSVIFGLVAHVLRAYRWNILLEPLGYEHLSTFRTYLAVMTGYMANMFVPRMGEVTRCAILKKTDNVAMTSSLGSVVAERTFDLLILVSMIMIGFILEFDKLAGFAQEHWASKIGAFKNINTLALTLVAGFLFFLMVMFVAYRILRTKLRRNPLILKIRQFLREMLEGFLSVRKIKNRSGFWISTFGIWVLYYLMAYIVFFSIPETSHLGMLAGLSVLIMGGLGMSAPVQGGIGAYHIFVSSILSLYGVAPESGKFFAFILHTTQFLTVIIVGVISLSISLLISKKPENAERKENIQES